MNQEELYERIENYLDGTLSGAILVAFEKQLQEDTSFAKEVELHRKLHRELGNAKKRRLRGILDDLNKEVDISNDLDGGKGKSGFGNWMLGLGGVVLLVGLGWFLSKGGDDEPTQSIAAQKITPIAADSSQSDVIETVAVETSTPETPKKNQAKTPPSTNPSPKPIIVDNTPNPFFETILDNLEEDRLYQFELDGQVETLPKDQILLTIAGTLETAALKQTDQLILKAYLNNKTANLNSKPSFAGPLAIELLKESSAIAFAKKKKYAIHFSQELILEPGLYYYFIGKQDDFNPLYGGKFERKAR